MYIGLQQKSTDKHETILLGFFPVTISSLIRMTSCIRARIKSEIYED